MKILCLSYYIYYHNMPVFESICQFFIHCELKIWQNEWKNEWMNEWIGLYGAFVLNWAWRTFWGRWDNAHDTTPPPPRHKIHKSRSSTYARPIFPTMLSFHEWTGKKHYVSLNFNPLTVKLFNFNFHPLEVVSRWRDPQLQVSENYSDLTKWRSSLFKSCRLMSHFIFNILKGTHWDETFSMLSILKK